MYVILFVVILNFIDLEKFYVKVCFVVFLYNLQVYVIFYFYFIYIYIGMDKICDIMFYVLIIDV